jgi:hypothetical protein
MDEDETCQSNSTIVVNPGGLIASQNADPAGATLCPSLLGNFRKSADGIQSGTSPARELRGSSRSDKPLDGSI